MAKLETEHLFKGNIERVFEGISQYDQYPKYLPGITGVEILKPEHPDSICQVRYEAQIIKSFFYTLDMYALKPHKIWWKLASSNIMKVNDGSWDFEAKGENQTRALYALDVKFKGLVPSALTDQVAKANLPAMLSGFQKMIDHVK